MRFSSSSRALAFLRSAMNCTSPRILELLLLERPRKPPPAEDAMARFGIDGWKLGSVQVSCRAVEQSEWIDGFGGMDQSKGHVICHDRLVGEGVQSLGRHGR